MLCPNCDGILNATGCQACGYKPGDAMPAHRLAPNTAHPLKQGGSYPQRPGEPKTVPVVDPKEAEALALSIDQIRVAPGFTAPGSPPEPTPYPLTAKTAFLRDALLAEPTQVEAEIVPAPIPDPVLKSVQ